MFPLFESLRQKTNTSNDTSHLQHGFAISWFDKLRRSPNCVDDVAYLQLGDIEEGKEIDESSERDTSLDEESLKPSRTHPVVKRMVGWLHLFLPSFLQNSSSESKKLHPTAWLDGLRGVAALFVVMHHSSLLWFSWDLHNGWDGTITGNGMWFIQLPFIRLMIAGAPQVMIFFVVSGYALSYKPLKLARQGRFAEVGSTLASSIFRRHPRLFMPAAVMTFFTALMTWMGWFNTTDWGAVAVPNREPPRSEMLWDQLAHYGWTQVDFTNPVSLGPGNPYDPNLWTLPIEFHDSMVVFVCLAAFTRLPNRVRLVFSFALLSYVEWMFVNWSVFLFLGGMFICDIHFEIERVTPSRSLDSDFTISGVDTVQPMWARAPRGCLSRAKRKVIPKNGLLRKMIGLASFILAIYILSMPERVRGAASSPGYMTLTAMAPERFGDNLWYPIAAVFLVFVIDQASFLQILFTTKFVQYLGRISFSLYMVHGPLLWTWGLLLARKCVTFTGQETDGKYVLGIALAAFLWWPVAIYVADFVQRCVDAQCVQFTRWMYDKLAKWEP